MDTKFNACILSTMIFGLWQTAVSSRKHDICLRDTFDANCAENEVIQMAHAQYGRMYIGRCIPEDVGIKMGCQEDVLSYLDSICSGRQSCQLRLQDYLTDGHQPCPVGLESFLSLQYTCIPVQLSTTTCAGAPLQVLGTQGMLANVITERTGQGSPDCPWEVRGSPGQKIRLSLHDYSVRTPATSPTHGGGSESSVIRLPDGPDICQIYAKVTEDGKKNSIPLCGGGAREKVVFLSEAEGIQITISNTKHNHNPAYFLLRFEIIGCADFKPPEGAVTTRQENDISVYCPGTGSRWQVKCDGSSWTTGKKDIDCHIADGQSISVGTLFNSAQTIPQWILIAVIIAAAAIIAVPIFVIGIISFRRRHGPMTQSVYMPQLHTNKYMPHHVQSAKEHEPMLDQNDTSHSYTRHREFTNTTQRHIAARPGVALPCREFPALPLPPTGSKLNDGNNTLNRSLNHEGYPTGSHNANLKPFYTKDTNECPHFVRSTRGTSDTKSPFCHELDPGHTDFQRMTPLDRTESESETLSINSSLPQPPEELSSYK